MERDALKKIDYERQELIKEKEVLSSLLEELDSKRNYRNQMPRQMPSNRTHLNHSKSVDRP